ncbi:hypothetical protein [Methanoregula formicica]|uniref:hypothetical protein n=1 Tax=Methanoregula formicica TaxID=882104 RepID=UPI0011D21763|nr:hypothetical protein [Methanoregula formicica]
MHPDRGMSRPNGCPKARPLYKKEFSHKPLPVGPQEEGCAGTLKYRVRPALARALRFSGFSPTPARKNV